MSELHAEEIEVTAVHGKELYTPVAYNTFEVGPFTMTARVPKAKATEALAWMSAQLGKHAEAERARKAAAFLSGLKVVGDEVARRGGGR